jgi:hypothetical protein
MKATIPDTPSMSIIFSSRHSKIYAEVVTFVAGSLEAGGLPGYPEVLV